MNSGKEKSLLLAIAPTLLILLFLFGLTGYSYIQITTLNNKISSLSLELSSTTNALNQNLGDLRNQTAGISGTLMTTQENINQVKNKVGGVEQVVGTISGTVGTLEKLSRSDPQLLKKYSKVYFLNENYNPASLAPIPNEYLYSDTFPMQLNAQALPYLISLISTAKSEGITIFVKSGYRSFLDQKSLKTAYSVQYGAGTANAFSADQGYSEHQLGTTIDFISTGQNGNLAGFDKTVAFGWLQANAYRFGFVLSYPKGNKYYMYEAWHWRFVGVDLALYLHSKNLNFYNLDQREIDKYLVNMF